MRIGTKPQSWPTILESKRRRDANENISRRSVRSYTQQGQEGEVSARSVRRNIPREVSRDRAGENRAFRDPSICHRTMLPWCRDMVRSAQKCGENRRERFGRKMRGWREEEGEKRREKTPDKPEVYATNYALENIHGPFFRGKHPFLVPLFFFLRRSVNHPDKGKRGERSGNCVAFEKEAIISRIRV